MRDIASWDNENPMRTNFLKMHLIKAGFSAAFAALFFCSPAMAATIIWDAAATDVNLADETQVFTDGTLVAAVNFFAPTTTFAPNDSNSATATVTVNGVTFVNLNAPGGVAHVTFPSGTNQSLFTNAAPVGNYETLLSSTLYVFNNSGIPITFTGLTIGQDYKIEVWSPIWDQNSYIPRFSSSPSDGATQATAPDQSPSLNLGIEAGGGTSVTTPPQLVFGTFTANSTTQDLYYFGHGPVGVIGMIGALELRAVPEPQTWALAALGASMVLFRLRRKPWVA